MFILQNSPMNLPSLAGLSADQMDIEQNTIQFDMTLSMWETPAGLRGYLEYSTDLFDAETISSLNAHFQTLLEGIVANPEQRLSELPLLTESERQQLLVKWNATQAAYPQEKNNNSPIVNSTNAPTNWRIPCKSRA
jgi:non-ribosomal peptide synthetase component F